jgi:hypothetical protein
LKRQAIQAATACLIIRPCLFETIAQYKNFFFSSIRLSSYQWAHHVTCIILIEKSKAKKTLRTSNQRKSDKKSRTKVNRIGVGTLSNSLRDELAVRRDCNLPDSGAGCHQRNDCRSPSIHYSAKQRFSSSGCLSTATQSYGQCLFLFTHLPVHPRRRISGKIISRWF